MQVRAIPVGMLLFILAATSCAPQRTPTSTEGGSAPSAAQTEAQRGPKVMTLAIQTEPKGLIAGLAFENSRIGGVRQPKAMVHNLLMVENHQQEYAPQLASEAISIERGTWRLNPDGSMDTTWKLRPNVKWHDGAPFTSEDLLFTFNVIKDAEIPNTVGATTRLMTAATAPDPLTFEIHWASPYVEADRAPGLEPLPRHLFEDTYRNDKASFANSPRLTTEFVGLGPYRLVRWEPGSHLELARFDDYWRGRPPLDQVFVRFVSDPNTMVTNILSGAVDVTLPPAVDLEAALDVRQRWKGSGNQVLIGPSGTMRFIMPQHRPEFAKPAESTTNVLVRQALYHAMDRQALNDTVVSGVGVIADSFYRSNDPLRPQLESSIPQYPFDLNRAQQLLAQAGWVRGSDGNLVHQQTRERLELEINGGDTRYIKQEQNIVADSWKKLGVQVNLFNLPAALANAMENRVERAGSGIYAGFSSGAAGTGHSKLIPRPQNRYTGGNFGGYHNPRIDTLVDQLDVTIPADQRLPLLREHVNILMTDVAFWPMYWDVTNVMALKHVKGIANGEGPYHTWNFYEWDVVRQ